jgi:hypothetical protein
MRDSRKHLIGTLQSKVKYAIISDPERIKEYIGFEVLTAVVMKRHIFWDITPCTPFKVNRGFA